MGAVISLIFDAINSLSEGLLTPGPLTKDLAQGIPELYTFAVKANGAVLPVGYTILALFFLLELLKCSQKAESAGGGVSMGAQMIAGVLVKLGLCKLLMDNTGTLMSALFNVMNYITTKVAEICAIDMDATALRLDSMELALASLSFFSAIPYLLVALIVLLLMAFVWLRTQLMVYLRFIEAYLYLIIAPVPLATLPGEEWSQIGKSFLKSFAAVAIQGTLLYLTLAFYPVLVSTLSHSVLAMTDSILSALLKEAFYALLLLFALSGTTQLASRICNAM